MGDPSLELEDNVEFHVNEESNDTDPNQPGQFIQSARSASFWWSALTFFVLALLLLIIAALLL